MQTIDQMIDSRQNARFSREGRAYDSYSRQSDKCDRLIGELVREGKTIYYVVTVRGQIKEDCRRMNLINFLIRNQYV